MARSTARRCSATTREGRPCRQNPQPGSDPPLCMIHAGLSRLQEAPPERRCRASTVRGTRCRMWALPDSDPPRCVVHAGLNRLQEPPPERRCTATTLGGRPCRQYATLDSKPPLCPFHGGLTGLEQVPPERRCTATTEAGCQCRQWAIRDSDPPRCSAHGDRFGPPPEHRRCTAQLHGGDRCPSWSLRNSDPPLCATHGGNAGFPLENTYAVTHGFYISRLLPADLAGIEADLKALDEGRLNLDEELFACRWLARELAIATQPEQLKTLSVRQIVRYAGAILGLLETISLILKTKRQIDGIRARTTFPASGAVCAGQFPGKRQREELFNVYFKRLLGEGS